MMDALLLTTTAASWFMTGLIWFVQIVHYPLMNTVGAEPWKAYHRRHTAQTTWVVMPVMFIELGSMILLFAIDESREQFALWIAGTLLAIVWVSTFLIQVPAHRTLIAGFCEQRHRRLVRTNWVRTLAWTARSLLLTFVVWQAITSQ